jgi:hypothetical protein
MLRLAVTMILKITLVLMMIEMMVTMVIQLHQLFSKATSSKTTPTATDWIRTATRQQWQATFAS